MPWVGARSRQHMGFGLSSWAMSASISRDHSRRQRRLVGSSSQDPSMPFSTNSRTSTGPKSHLLGRLHGAAGPVRLDSGGSAARHQRTRPSGNAQLAPHAGRDGRTGRTEAAGGAVRRVLAHECQQGLRRLSALECRSSITPSPPAGEGGDGGERQERPSFRSRWRCPIIRRTQHPCLIHSNHPS
jgi:hypothetical protein